MNLAAIWLSTSKLPALEAITCEDVSYDFVRHNVLVVFFSSIADLLLFLQMRFHVPNWSLRLTPPPLSLQFAKPS